MKTNYGKKFLALAVSLSILIPSISVYADETETVDDEQTEEVVEEATEEETQDDEATEEAAEEETQDEEITDEAAEEETQDDEVTNEADEEELQDEEITEENETEDEAVADSTVSPEDYVIVNGDEDTIGNLTIIARYTEGESITYGHSYLVFTSYEDNLTLNFTDLYAYYTFDDEFKSLSEEDIYQLSWRSTFELLAPEMYPDLTLDEFLELTVDERNEQYPDLMQAIEDYCDENCFTLHLGKLQEDKRYRSTAYSCVLNSGDYITIGNYNMSQSTQQLITDTLLYSSLKSEIEDILKDHTQEGVDPQQIILEVTSLYDQYTAGELTKDELMTIATNYLSNSVVGEVYDLVVTSYTNHVNLIDGNTRGGIYVNRELNRQKVAYDQSPNHVYSMDINAQQMRDLMTYINEGNNYFSNLTHSCATVSSGGWNAAFGYVRDEEGNNTEEHSSLYIDPKDTTYSWLSGLNDTPKKIYEVLGEWADLDLGGKSDEWEIVHGVEVPGKEEKEEIDVKTDDPSDNHNSETETNQSEVETTKKNNESTINTIIPNTGIYQSTTLLTLALLAGGIALVMKRRK